MKSEIILGAFIALVLLLSGFWESCQAEAKPWPQWTPETKLALAKCVQAESDFNTEKEAATLSWVLLKRWQQQKQGWDLEKQIVQYCAVFDERSARYYSPRASAIRASTFRQPKHGKPEKWVALHSFINRFEQQRVKDPCPRATHWAGRIDKIPPTWVCPCGPPEFANQFCHPQR